MKKVTISELSILLTAKKTFKYSDSHRIENRVIIDIRIKRVIIKV